jgi:hypothetical protein
MMSAGPIRLVQFTDNSGRRRVGVPAEGGTTLELVGGVERVFDLAMAAIRAGARLEPFVRGRMSGRTTDYEAVVRERRLHVPLDHPDPMRIHVTGTGLTHLGSADARDRMHRALEASQETLTDSMKMFRRGLEGGRPAAGEIGDQPEWFYKGNGRFLVAPEQPLTRPGFAEDGGEEPELAGLYVIDADGAPVRIGVALANEFSDHVVERRNYLLLAHSKLRQSSFGPELRVGPVPSDIRGTSRIRRAGRIVFERPFLTGEANMSHTLANLEHHHFKYAEHRIPGDVHVHYFGTATLSVSEGVKTEAGDVFEIEAEGFGRPLRNPLGGAPPEASALQVRAL